MTSEPSLVIEPSGLGVVSLGPERHAPAGAATISLLGCLVTVDPCTPEEPPHCLVSDLGSASAVVEALYGSAVAQRLMELDGPLSGREEVPFTVGPELAVVVNLGTVRWLRSNSPLPLDQGLLDLEESVLLGQIAELLDPLDEQWLESLVDMAPQLIQLTGEREVRPEGLAAVVANALELLASHLPVSDRLRADAAQRLAHWSTPQGFPHAPTLGAAQLSGELAPVGALHAGATSSLYVGTSTVGWDDVPVGTTSRAERNVQWTLQIDDEEATLSVGVEAAQPVLTHPALGRAPRRIDTLAFDLLLPKWPFPVAAGRLRPGGPDEAWVGQEQLESPARAAVTAAIAGGRRSPSGSMAALPGRRSRRWSRRRSDMRPGASACCVSTRWSRSRRCAMRRPTPCIERGTCGATGGSRRRRRCADPWSLGPPLSGPSSGGSGDRGRLPKAGRRPGSPSAWPNDGSRRRRGEPTHRLAARRRTPSRSLASVLFAGGAIRSSRAVARADQLHRSRATIRRRVVGGVLTTIELDALVRGSL